MNRRIVGLIAALLLAVIGTVTIVAYVRGADDRAKGKQKSVQVLVVQKAVPAGTPAEQLGDRVKLESIVKQVEADGAVTDTTQLAGLVASATLVPGEQVVKARFVNASLYRAAGSGISVPAGLLQTTLKLDPERALGGLVTAGMHVAVTASIDDKDNKPAASEIVAHQILVTNVQLASSSSSSGSTNASSSEASSNGSAKPGTAPSGQLYVTLALAPAAVQQVVFAAERGGVWLSTENSDAAAPIQPAVTRENLFK